MFYEIINVFTFIIFIIVAILLPYSTLYTEKLAKKLTPSKEGPPITTRVNYLKVPFIISLPDREKVYFYEIEFILTTIGRELKKVALKKRLTERLLEKDIF